MGVYYLCTYMHTHTHKHTDPHESDFKLETRHTPKGFITKKKVMRTYSTKISILNHIGFQYTCQNFIVLSRPRPIMLKILPIILLSTAQKSPPLYS